MVCSCSAFFEQALGLTVYTRPGTCIDSVLHSLAVSSFLLCAHAPIADRTARIRALGALVGSNVSKSLCCMHRRKGHLGSSWCQWESSAQSCRKASVAARFVAKHGAKFSSTESYSTICSIKKKCNWKEARPKCSKMGPRATRPFYSIEKSP